MRLDRLCSDRIIAHDLCLSRGYANLWFDLYESMIELLLRLFETMLLVLLLIEYLLLYLQQSQLFRDPCTAYRLDR